MKPLKPALCLAAACAALVSFSVLCSCSVEEPEIAELKASRLLIQDDEGGYSLALSVFALFNGGDVADDFAMMSVTHEETGIFWEIPESSCLLFPGSDNYFWAGSSSLSPVPSILAGGSSIWGAEGFLPEGAYTVTADNAAGSSATASFVLDKPFYFTSRPATFRLLGSGDNTRWNIVLSEGISTGDVSVYLFLLDEDGNPLSSIKIARERFRGIVAEGKVSDLTEALSSGRNAESAPAAISCYVEHEASASAVLLVPLSLE